MQYAASAPTRVGLGVPTVHTMVTLMGAVNRYAASVPSGIGLGVTTVLTMVLAMVGKINHFIFESLIFWEKVNVLLAFEN
jgi:hypothetical protein